jgi:hypothetical protein
MQYMHPPSYAGPSSFSASIIVRLHEHIDNPLVSNVIIFLDEQIARHHVEGGGS